MGEGIRIHLILTIFTFKRLQQKIRVLDFRSISPNKFQIIRTEIALRILYYAPPCPTKLWGGQGSLTDQNW